MPEIKISLDVINIATPCHENWEAMHGGAEKRFCDSCEKHVFNLSEMTLDEAREVVTQYAGSAEGLCVRYNRDQNGKMVTTDRSEYEGDTRQHRRRTRQAAGSVWAPIVAVMSVVSGIAAAFFGIGDRVNQRQDKIMPPGQVGQPLMGEVCPPPPPARQPIDPEIMGEMEILMGDICFEEPIRIE